MAQLDINASTRLLERGELAEQGPPEAVRLPIDLIDPNGRNPRKALVEVEDLAESIKTFGLLQPITVRRQGERYELLGGHRRRAAFLHLQKLEPYNVVWKTIPAVIKTFDDDSAYLALLAGQLHSKSWAPREEAAALEALASTRTLEEVGQLVHHGASWVSKRLRVYADAALAGPVQTGQLPVSVANELLLIKDIAVRREVAERAVREGWSKDHARAQVRALRASSLVRQIGRLAHDLWEALALVQPVDLPRETAETLNLVRRRIMTLSGAPIMPSIEQAEKVAGVKTDRPAKATGGRRKPGYKPRPSPN